MTGVQTCALPILLRAAFQALLTYCVQRSRRPTVNTHVSRHGQSSPQQGHMAVGQHRWQACQPQGVVWELSWRAGSSDGDGTEHVPQAASMCWAGPSSPPGSSAQRGPRSREGWGPSVPPPSPRHPPCSCAGPALLQGPSRPGSPALWAQGGAGQGACGGGGDEGWGKIGRAHV